jgi:hypothetical protein
MVKHGSRTECLKVAAEQLHNRLHFQTQLTRRTVKPKYERRFLKTENSTLSIRIEAISCDENRSFTPVVHGEPEYVPILNLELSNQAKHQTEHSALLQAVCLVLCAFKRHKKLGHTQQLQICVPKMFTVTTLSRNLAVWRKLGWKKKDGSVPIHLEVIQNIDRLRSGLGVTFVYQSNTFK